MSPMRCTSRRSDTTSPALCLSNIDTFLTLASPEPRPRTLDRYESPRPWGRHTSQSPHPVVCVRPVVFTPEHSSKYVFSYRYICVAEHGMLTFISGSSGCTTSTDTRRPRTITTRGNVTPVLIQDIAYALLSKKNQP